MKPKPAPDVVIAACRGLAVDAKRSIMVGDTSRDVKAAHAAGAEAVLVVYSTERAQSANAEANWGAKRVITSLMQLVDSR